MFMPRRGDEITVTLPGEVLRCAVARVVDRNTLICEMTAQPMTRNHDFRKDQLFGARRKITPLGEIWQAVTDVDTAAPAKRARG